MKIFRKLLLSLFSILLFTLSFQYMIDLINESYLQPFFTFYNVVEYSYGFTPSSPRSSNLTSDNDGNSISPGETSGNILQKNKPTDLKIQELFSQIDKSVVQISSEDETIGSGFVYDSNGHIITTNSVIPTAKDPHVTFSDGTIYTGKVIGSEPYSDLAVVLVNDVPKEKLFPLTLGNSSKLIIGERIAGVGNPFGFFGSLTEGIVTGLGRVIPSTFENIVGNDTGTVSFSIPDIIQTNAAINPGDYGGPLLNLNSEVI